MENCHLCPDFKCRTDQMSLLRRHLRETHETSRLPGHPRRSRWDMNEQEAEQHRAALILRLLSSPSSSDSIDSSSYGTSSSSEIADSSSHDTSSSLLYSPPSPMPSLGSEPDIELDFMDTDVEETIPEPLPAANCAAPAAQPPPCSGPAQGVPDGPEGSQDRHQGWGHY